MHGPKHQGDYSDRELDCQEDVAGKIVESLDEAEAAGWDRIEAAKALVEAAIAIQMGERGTDPNE
ncbi:hypothetical protein ACJKIH_03055 [Brucella pseudogrignonensis]|uniref:hypothetical protein n=1 Tax=Brucella pseudogrignonensis TaxID=419475 RepID=UPI0038B5DB9E